MGRRRKVTMQDEGDSSELSDTANDSENSDFLSFKNKKKKRSKESEIYGIFGSESEEEESARPSKMDKDVEFVTSKFETKIEQNEDEEDEANDQKPTKSMNKEDKDKKKKEEKIDQDFGKFEQYTKGIGMKLLKKMGYEPGKGLGADKQGIVNPIEAKTRSGKKVGLGFGPKESSSSSSEEDEEEKLQEIYNSRFLTAKKGRKKGWKKKHENEKPSIKSLEQLMEQVGEMPSKELKIIDMTGKEQRELSNISEMKSQKFVEETDDAKYPELTHNLKLLVHITEQKIIDLNRKLKKENETFSILNEELNIKQSEAENLSKKIKLNNLLFNYVKEIDFKNMTSLKDLRPVFAKLYVELNSNFEIVEKFIMSIIYKLWRYKQWNPLDDPKGMDYEALLEFFQDGWLKKEPSKTQSSTPFESLMYHVWLPKVRSSLLTVALHDERLISFLELWQPVLSNYLFDEILINQLILPRLLSSIESWDYANEIIPLHTYILLWIPLIGDRLSSIYVHLRHQISKSLSDWHPSDKLAISILKPWKQIFSSSDFNLLLSKCILPKLAAVLDSEFAVNPSNQDMNPFIWIMRWKSILPTDYFLSLIERYFFPKWLKALFNWLTSPNPNYDQISMWYSQWKSQYPADLSENPVIKFHFKKALDMMNQLIVDKNLAFESFNPYMTYNDFSLKQESKSKSSSLKKQFQLTFKEYIERKAAENQLVFVSANRSHPVKGKPLYKLGNFVVWLDTDILYLYKDQKDIPTSFEELTNLKT